MNTPPPDVIESALERLRKLIKSLLNDPQNACATSTLTLNGEHVVSIFVVRGEIAAEMFELLESRVRRVTNESGPVSRPN